MLRKRKERPKKLRGRKTTLFLVMIKKIIGQKIDLPLKIIVQQKMILAMILTYMLKNKSRKGLEMTLKKTVKKEKMK
jgi:hypothetical protein